MRNREPEGRLGWIEAIGGLGEGNWCCEETGAVWFKEEKLASWCDLVRVLFCLRGELELPVRERALFGDEIDLPQPVLVGSLSLG